MNRSTVLGFTASRWATLAVLSHVRSTVGSYRRRVSLVERDHLVMRTARHAWDGGQFVAPGEALGQRRTSAYP